MGALLRTRAGLRRLLWRDVGRVQLGEDPAHAVVLDGLGPGEEAVLDDLVEGVDLADLRGRCRARGARGAAPAAVDHLLSLLRAADALEPLPAPGARSRSRAGAAEAAVLGLVRGGSGWDVLARRADAAVRVEGCSRTAVAVATGLVEAGVGTVELVTDDGARVRPEHVMPGGLTAQDVGLPARAATARLLEERTRSLPPVPRRPARDRGGSAAGAGLTVLVARGAVPPARGDRLLRQDAPHLAVVLRVRTAVVGPLVLPGRTACLRCVDLHRGDLDPEWPRVAAQLAHPVPATAATPGEDIALVRLSAALAVARSLAHLDTRGGPVPGPDPARSHGAPPPVHDDDPGTTWDVDAGDGLHRGARWTPHPACGCTWPPG